MKQTKDSSLKSEIRDCLNDILLDFSAMFAEMEQSIGSDDLDEWLECSSCPYYGLDKQRERVAKILNYIKKLEGGK